MSGDMEDEDTRSNLLGRGSILYYGVGHMLNDITAACWFTYLLVFLTDIGLSSSDAAAVMFSGQMADGLTTVFVGELVRLGSLHKFPNKRINLGFLNDHGKYSVANC
ncbi:hypothetical protein Leryth_019097 [Lithospermum erythrorhizon]|nr:hypothetical protein Leryth_019097 [Lithospermum erythrorhizon]